jgi:hypothetical protein
MEYAGGPSSTAYPDAEFPMTEERKFAILIAATILSARKLAQLEDPDKLTPKKVGTVETAIRHAAYILGEIDKKWPTKAPAAFTN